MTSLLDIYVCAKFKRFTSTFGVHYRTGSPGQLDLRVAGFPGHWVAGSQNVTQIHIWYANADAQCDNMATVVSRRSVAKFFEVQNLERSSRRIGIHILLFWFSSALTFTVSLKHDRQYINITCPICLRSHYAFSLCYNVSDFVVYLLAQC